MRFIQMQSFNFVKSMDDRRQEQEQKAFSDDIKYFLSKESFNMFDFHERVLVSSRLVLISRTPWSKKAPSNLWYGAMMQKSRYWKIKTKFAQQWQMRRRQIAPWPEMPSGKSQRPLSWHQQTWKMLSKSTNNCELSTSGSLIRKQEATRCLTQEKSWCSATG